MVFARQQAAKARRAANPLVEPGLFRDRVFPASLFGSLLFFAVMNGLMFVLVVYLQSGRGADAFGAGLTMLPWSAGLGAGSLVTGMVPVPRFGARVMRAGVFTVLCGLAASGLLNAVQQLGATVGVAVLGAAYFGLAQSSAGARLALCLAIVLLGVVLALTYPMLQRDTQSPRIPASSPQSS